MTDHERDSPTPGSKIAEDESMSSRRTSSKEQDLHTKNDQTPSKDIIDKYHDTPSRTSTSTPHSTHPSSIPPTAIPVPRPHRRGLLSHLTLIPEITHPTHYPRPTKWALTFIVAFCAMAAPMGSAIVMPVLHDISTAFSASHTVTNMSVAVYMLSMSIFPLWWSSFSERVGRRTIYIVSFGLFVLFAILSALARSITVLIVMRTLSGGAAASVQAVGAGTISDIWEVRERGKAMGVFYLGPLCGPLLAPIVGGAIGEGLGWRSTQWFLVGYGGVTVVFIVFALPETLARKEGDGDGAGGDGDVEKGGGRLELTRTNTRASTIRKTKSILTHLRQVFIDPLKIIAWLRYPPVALTIYSASITFGTLYILNISLQHTFSLPPYTYPTLTLGLLYIPNSLGYLLASLLGGRWIDHIMHREARRANRYDDAGNLIFQPMDRMKENAWIAAILWPTALIIYGWTAHFKVHVAFPLAANFFFGIGSMLIFSLVNTMLTEFMPRRAASGIALNNFVRNICSFAGAVVAEPALDGIGNGWLMTVLGVWGLVTGCVALGAMGRWGVEWRERMVKELG